MKKQRALIALHLQWLDAQIAAQAQAPAQASSKEASSSGHADPTIESEATHSKPTHTASSTTAQESQPPKRAAVDDLALSEWTQPAREGLAPSQKWGCILLATLVTIGVLALFWLLPMWLYD